MAIMARLLKFFLRLLLRLLYGVEVSGMENYHKAGERVLIIANHTSLLDVVLLYAWLPETPTFAINTRIYSQKLFKPLYFFADLFVMDPTNPLSLKSMINFIKQDKKAVIFPEGRITVTGSLMKIYDGPGMIADKSDATILPISIDGAQYSRLSYMKGVGHVFWLPKITLKVLAPEKIKIAPELSGHDRRNAAARQLYDLMYKLSYSSFNHRKTLYSTLLEASNRFGKNHPVIEDFNRDRLTYKQIILRSILLGGLIKKQTSSNEHVGVILPNVNALPILFFALQFIGRVPAMLNFTSGLLSVKRACNTAQVKTIYTSRRFIENAKLEELITGLEQHYAIIYLEDLRKKTSLINKLSALFKSIRPQWYYSKQISSNPDAAAVILFTSGSEGHPKGVVLSHSNLLSNFAQVRCHINFNATDTIFSCLPLFHSFGLNAGFLMPVFAGGKTFLYPTPLHYRIIPELIYELKITILFGTNTFFKGYARHAHAFDFHNLKFVVAGAEKLQSDTVQLWHDKFGIRILQGYGVTETSPVISVDTKMLHKAGTVGRLMSDMECYIEPVEGIERGGRLIVKGPNIMQGYLLSEKPGELQAPSTECGPGWYDTGDIADIDDEGFITILGRAKRFAKIGGEMVSLSAVEELAMLAWPNINHAAVSLHDDRKGEKIILVTENPHADRKQLQKAARQHHINELAIPKKILLAESLPVLNTGKIDYIMLTELVKVEDENEHSTGWLEKLNKLVHPETATIKIEND
jgi:acyl-[acyl-carrier-protein]-phospholipid O-acyltransferase / long-chain-fatty-acid--[acyl-carrier-protein] ligase